MYAGLKNGGFPTHSPTKVNRSQLRWWGYNVSLFPLHSTHRHPALREITAQTPSWDTDILMTSAHCSLRVLAVQWHCDKTFSASSTRLHAKKILCNSLLLARSLSGHLSPCWVCPIWNAKPSHRKLMLASCKSFYLSSCFLFWHLSVIHDYLWVGAWTVYLDSAIAYLVNDLQI